MLYVSSGLIKCFFIVLYNIKKAFDFGAANTKYIVYAFEIWIFWEQQVGTGKRRIG